MGQIVLNIGDSVVTKLRDEVSGIIFADRYRDVAAILEQAIDHVIEMDRPERYTHRQQEQATDYAVESGRQRRYPSRRIANIYECRIHNSVFVNGRRGAGKTHFLINLEAYIGRYFKKMSDDIFVPRPFDPTLIDETETYLSAIIAHLIREYESRVESVHAGDVKHLQTEVDLAIDEVAHALDSQQKAVKSTGMDNIGYYHTGGTLEQTIHTLLGKVANALQVRVIVLPIDDIDMVPRRAWDVLNILRRYLASPYLVPIVSGQFDLYHNILHTEVPRWFNLSQEKRIKPPPEPDFDEWQKITSGRPWMGPDGESRGRKPEEQDRYHEVFVNDIADGYFSKIFPRHNEIRLGSIFDREFQDRLVLRFGDRNDDRDGDRCIRLSDYIALETAVIHFGVVNPREKLRCVTEFHRSLREFLQHLKALNSDVKRLLDLLDWKNAEEEPLQDHSAIQERLRKAVGGKELPTAFVRYRGRVVDFAKNSRYWKLDPFLFQTLGMERNLLAGQRLSPGDVFRCLRREVVEARESPLSGRPDFKAIQRIDPASATGSPVFRLHDAGGKASSMELICAGLAATDEATQHYDGRPQLSIARMFEAIFDSFSETFSLTKAVEPGLELLNIGTSEIREDKQFLKINTDMLSWRTRVIRHLSMSQIRLTFFEYGQQEEDVANFLRRIISSEPISLLSCCRLHFLAILNSTAILERKRGISRMAWYLEDFDAESIHDILPLSVRLNCPELSSRPSSLPMGGLYGALLTHPIIKDIVSGKPASRIKVVMNDLLLTTEEIVRLIAPPPPLLMENASVRISYYLDWMVGLQNKKPRLAIQIGNLNRKALLAVLADQTGVLYGVLDLLWRNDHGRAVIKFLAFLGVNNLSWEQIRGSHDGPAA